MTAAYWSALFGGMLIGLSAAMLLLLNGRIAGVSGIVGRLAQGAQLPTNAAFVLGLIVGPMVYLTFFGRWPAVTITTSMPLIAIAGLLVGLGSGCTSGHGVLGLARLSPFIQHLSQCPKFLENLVPSSQAKPRLPWRIASSAIIIAHEEGQGH